jgi:hypothetical protein
MHPKPKAETLKSSFPKLRYCIVDCSLFRELFRDLKTKFYSSVFTREARKAYVQDFTALTIKSLQSRVVAGLARVFGVIYITSKNPLALLKKGYRTDEEKSSPPGGLGRSWNEDASRPAFGG